MKISLLTIAFACSSMCLYAQSKDVTTEKFTPFYTTEQAPRLEKVLPEPPAFNSTRYQDDFAMYQWGKSIRHTERGQQAVEDAGINAAYFMKRFSPAMGIELTAEKFPELFRLLSRAHQTETQAGMGAKKFFKRVRPYQQFNEQSGVPASENPTDFTSYPSGHTHASWLVGLILMTIDPAHAEDIMKVAYELGQSRVIVGFHYQSDIEAGRYAASITYARISSMEEFQKMLQKAVKEFRDSKR